MSLLSVSRIILKNFISKPVTEKYPFTPKVYPEKARGSINIEIEKCIFCSICQRKCPTFAIGVDKGAKSWEIDRLSCISCGYCVEVCPKKCLDIDNKYAPSVSIKSRDRFVMPVQGGSQEAPHA